MADAKEEYRRPENGDEIVPILGNPAFDTSYDTFQTESPGPSHSRGSIIDHPSTNDQIGLDIESLDNEDNAISDVNIDDLEDSLPSSQLRKNKTIVRPGSLRKRKGADVIDEVQEVGELGTQHTARIKEATVPLEAKMSLRRAVSHSQQKHVGGWKHFKYGVSVTWDHFKNNFVDFIKNLDIWRSNLKGVDVLVIYEKLKKPRSYVSYVGTMFSLLAKRGKFGSGVLSYFLFLRWLFLLDIFITILVLAFVVAPQLMHSPSSKSNNATFTGIGFLTGEGWFEKTEMFYGTYYNATITLMNKTPYNLPFAYLCVVGGYVLFCVVILVRSMGLSYKENYISGKDFRNSFFTKMFCSWDYAITQQNSAGLQSKSIYNDFLESLSEAQEKRKRKAGEICQLVCLRIVTNFIVFAMMAAACFLIQQVSDQIIKDLKTEKLITDLLPAITISALNLLLPFAFRIIASIERYQLPKTAVEVSLFRTILLKLASLCVYVVVIYSEVGCLTGRSTTDRKCEKVDCWETWVGQQVYKLTIVDIIFLLLVTFFGEFVRRILATYVPICEKKVGMPGFDISRNVLDLIYVQGLCWIGTFFCPMLPPITVIKLFILFYFKRFSVLRNCRPSTRPFKAAKMYLLYMFLLGLMLGMTMVVLGYVIMNETTLKPSKQCGPFRGKETVYDSVKDLVNKDFAVSIREIVKAAASAAVLAVVFAILLLIAYYFKLRKSSAEKKIKLLKQQITLAGQDKLYLLKEIREILKKRGKTSGYVVS